MKRLALIRSGVVLAIGGSALVALGYACVPADTRPVPASLYLTVSASQATAQGITTADGWSLAFDRVLVGIGRSSISSSCTRYSEADYDRVLDLKKSAGGSPQKLSNLFGLGHCDVRFRIGTPSSEALLGEGTNNADITFMRTRARDRWVNRGGVGLRVIGSATRDGDVRRFDLVFRTQLRYSFCSTSPDAGGLLEVDPDAGDDDPIDAGALVDAGAEAEAPPPEGVGEVLESEATINRVLRIETEKLFSVPDEAVIRFDPYAQGDKNGDGVVTVDELVGVPINVVHDAGPFEAGLFVGNTPIGPAPGGGGPGGFARRAVIVETLADYMVVVLLPRLLRYGDVGGCGTSLNIDLGRDGGGGRSPF